MNHCFREPIPEIILASELLNRAVNEHNSWNREIAEKLFKEANIEVIFDWWNSIAGPRPPYVNFRELIDAPPLLPSERRIPVRMPSKEIIKAIHERDGYNCRFCGTPVIRPEIRKRIQNTYPSVVSFGKTNASRHRAFFAMWAQYDHILPHSRGGDNSLDNLILTCSACNFGRMSYTLEEVWLSDPRTKSPIITNWNWLEDFK